MGAIEVPVAESRRFGVLEVDEDSRVTGFQEKPATARAHALEPRLLPGLHGHLHLRHRGAGARAAARRRGGHEPRLRQATSSPSWWRAGERVYAYLFWDENKKESKYWRDVGTLDAYYEASMDLIQVDPVFNLYDPDWPLRTYQPQFPPAKFVFDEDGRRGARHGLDRLHGLHRLRQRGPALDPVARRARALVLRHPGLDPDAQRHRQPPRRGSAAPSSTATSRSRAGAVIGYDPAEDRRRHTVSEGGVVVVTPGEECFVDPQFAQAEDRAT